MKKLFGHQSPAPSHQKVIKKGQVTLELTAALILSMMLLVGMIKIFVWLNERLVQRQVDYEEGRVAAGSSHVGEYISAEDLTNVSPDNLTLPGEVLVDESDKSKYPELNLFK